MYARDNDGTVLITAVGRGWLRVPRAAWDALTAAVKRGDFDTHTASLRGGGGHHGVV